jgi:hypothetical protein
MHLIANEANVKIGLNIGVRLEVECLDTADRVSLIDNYAL